MSEKETPSYLGRGCAHWEQPECPHRESIAMLRAGIERPTLALLRDRLIADLNGLCGNCSHFYDR